MERSEMAAKLGSVSLFANLAPSDLDAIAGRMKEVHFQEGRAIVWRHLIQNRHDLLVGHRAQELLLSVDVEILEHVRGQRVGQKP